MYSMCLQHFPNTVEWIKKKKKPAICESLHPHGQMTQTQSCFCLAKGNGVKNTTIKMIFILRNYSFWHPQNNILCVSLRGDWVSLKQVLVLKTICLKLCQYVLLMDLKSIPPGPTMLAIDVGLLCPSSAACCGTSPLWTYQIKKQFEECLLPRTRSALDHSYQPHIHCQIHHSTLLLVSSLL